MPDILNCFDHCFTDLQSLKEINLNNIIIRLSHKTPSFMGMVVHDNKYFLDIKIDYVR